MSNSARKARKRAGTPYIKSRSLKRHHADPQGLGFISGPEIMARILARRSK